MSDLNVMTASALRTLLDRKQTSCVEIMRSVLAQIDKQEKEVRAFVTIRDSSELLDEAASIDARRARGEPIGPLAGLPIAVKDNICTRGLRTTAASRMLENFVPPYDATVVAKIRAADGIILGKTNMDEFSMGSSTENSFFGPTCNPHNLGRVPGGTSGGSAAAVAADMCIMAVGSDTGGSVRQPASFCGVVGFKPTYGRVSRFGLIAYGSSLDQIGPITKSVEDAALLLSVISGNDVKDSTSLPEPSTPVQLPTTGRPLRIGIPDEYFGPGLTQNVRKVIDAALAALSAKGHDLVPVQLPHTEYAVPAYYLIACAEASSNLARYDGVRYGYRAAGVDDLQQLYTRTRTEGFGAEVKRRILLGTYTLSAGYYDAYYLRAQKVRTLIRRDFDEAFKHCDVIAHPVAPTTAYELGSKLTDPLEMYLGDIFSVTANLTGLPAISVPVGKADDGMPVGLQFCAKALDERTTFHAAGVLSDFP